ncbi:MAG: helix-turn-helix transcriptional regulator [Halanaeroarchaeum sp.]
MKRGQVAGLLAIVVVLSAVTPLATAAQTSLQAPAEVDPDAVHMSVALQPDGDARWTVEYRVQLTTDNETQAFEDLVADVENNSTAYRDRFATRIEATVADAENETGRSMRATDFAVTAEIRQLPQTYGVLQYTFTWHNFAATEADRIVAGDALRGLFLDADTTLTVSWPSDYHATTVEPAATTSRPTAVTWAGPLDFATGEPTVIVEQVAPTTQGTDGTTTLPNGSTSAWLLVAAVFVGLILVGIAAVWYYRKQGEEEGDVPPAPGGDGPEGGAAASAQPAEGAGGEPPEELLSNEERVKRFLSDHGGRAKQQEIVDGLDWTEAKTSQVLSEMHDAGDVEKFRIGRENVVKLPDGDDGL